MEILIELTEDEVTSFDNFMKNFRPEEVTQEDFNRNIFFHGLAAYEQRVMHLMMEQAEKAKAEVIEEAEPSKE